MDMGTLHPEYLADVNVLKCPSDPAPDTILQLRDDGSGACGFPGAITNGDTSYLYVGWLAEDANDNSFRLATDTLGLDGNGDGLISTTITALVTYVIYVAGQQVTASNFTMLEMLLDQDVNTASVGAPRIDLPGAGNGGGDTIFRLREGIERFLVTDINDPSVSAQAQSELAILWDIVSTDSSATTRSEFNHIPGGANVLYLDGHVDYVRYPGPFPASRDWANTVGTLAGLLAM